MKMIEMSEVEEQKSPFLKVQRENRAMSVPAGTTVAATSSTLNPPPVQHHVLRLNSSANDEKKPSSATAKCRKLLCFKRLRFTVFADVVLTILVLGVLILIELGLIPERKFGFICKDPALSFPYNGDTIKIVPLLVGSYLGPLILLTLIEIIREKSLKNVRLGVIWEFYKELLIGATFVLLLTEIGKTLLGEFRPHFFYTCRPDSNENCTPGTFIDHYECMNEEFSSILIRDSAKSFPSGHSSLSVFSSLFCAYVVQTRLPSAVTGRILKPFLISVCVTWGLVCSLTRITDRRHHWWDVLSGATLGVLSVIFFAKSFHERLSRRGFLMSKISEKSVSSTMLLDVKNKKATSVRV